MSTNVTVKYSDDTTYSLVSNDIQQSMSQQLGGQSHVPYTARVMATRLGIGFMNIIITGDIATRTECRWSDIVAISFDGSTWQTVYFSEVQWSNPSWTHGVLHRYSLTILASSLREGAAVRWPVTAGTYYWGLQTVASVSQAGNASAVPELVCLAPKFYFPFADDIQDFAGQGLTFTRALAKAHGGVSYGVNTPIFDNGLFVSSETSQDTPKLTFSDLTAHSLCMRLKSTRYPSAWVIGAGAGTANLLTANQSNAETDTTGVSAIGATLTRNTSTPIAGTGDFKLVATGSPCLLFEPTPYITITPSKWYCGQATVRTTGTAAGRTVHAQLTWYTAADAEISSTDGVAVSAPTTATVISVIGVAPATAYKVSLRIWLDSAVASEVMYVDSLMLEQIPDTVIVFSDGSKNKLTLDFVNNTITWSDFTSSVSATFPTAHYLADKDVVEVVLTHNGATKAVHCRETGGTWADGSGTLAALVWTNEVTIGPLEGSIAHLIQYPYVLSVAEYGAMNLSLLPITINTLSIRNDHAETITKGTDGRLVTASGADISGNTGGLDLAITSVAQSVIMSAGLSMRWYFNIKETNLP